MTWLDTTTSPLPGIYPHIAKMEPNLFCKGRDNIGVGYTQHSERYLLKRAKAGVAEFVGARVSEVCGVPTCQPHIVTLQKQCGSIIPVFGSRLESGIVKFDESDCAAWEDQMSRCTNTGVFSAVLGIDLALGNDDRHWGNWLIQEQGGGKTALRCLDFSRSWPVMHPAQHPSRHGSANTWTATKLWELLGITFNQQMFYDVCATIYRLPVKWLRDAVLRPLIGVFLSEQEADAYCDWWQNSLNKQIIEAIHSLEYGVRP